MATLDSLLVQIDASTELLRRELAKGDTAVQQFVQKTETRFGSMQNRFTQVAGKLRSVFALFGVGFGVRAFSGWIASATQLDKLTRSQADALAGAKREMDEIHKSTDALGQALAIAVAPQTEKIAKFWAQIADNMRRAINPTAAEANAAERDRIAREIGQRARVIFDIESGHDAFGPARTRESRVAKLRKEVDELAASLRKLQEFDPPDEESTLDQEKWQKKLDELKEINTSFGKTTGLAKFPDLRAFEQSQLETISTGAGGLISSVSEMRHLTGLERFDFDKARTGIENMSKAMEEARQRSKDFADTFAAAFESRGIEAILSGDIRAGIRGLTKDFAELIIRLTVLRPLATSISDALSGVGGGGGFFSSLFGGLKGHAAGGHMNAGEPGWVGERGRELFIPDVSGRIISNSQSMRMASAGGPTIVQNFNVQAGLPTQWEAQLAMVSQVAAASAYDAVTSRLPGGRR